MQNAGMSSPTPNTRRDHLDLTAMLVLVVCCLFWGFQQVMVKATIAEVPSVLQAGIRFVGATALVLLWCAARGVKLGPLTPQRDPTFWPGLLAGALFAGEFAFLQLGLQLMPASRLTVFLYTSPFWVAALVPLAVKTERLGKMQWAGLLLAFVAVVFALRESWGAGSGQSLLGDMLALGAGACWGLTTVVIRTTPLGKAGAEKILFYQVAFSGPVLLLMSWAIGEQWRLPVSAFGWSSLALQAGVGAFASFFIWMWMLGRYPATKLSSFVFLTPVFALLVGAWWLSEPVTPVLLISLSCVALGIVLVNRR
jgi:drug/metabolite transporter (DMT)-like permease